MKPSSNTWKAIGSPGMGGWRWLGVSSREGMPGQWAGWLSWLWLLLMLPMPAVQGQDVVVVKRKGSSETLERRGTIVEWKGQQLILNSGSREVTIDNADIVEVRTDWPPAYVEGKKRLENGQNQEAGQHLGQAILQEQRPWVRRMIRAEQVRVDLAAGQFPQAIERFFAIVQSDPKTRFIKFCPLPWTGGQQIDRAQARRWMASKSLIEQLIGASWLLIGSGESETGEATRVLEQLTRSDDPNIRHLATAQLWRIRAVHLKTMSERQIKAWISRIDSMPADLRAGPWFLIAQTQWRLGETESAVLNFMRIPILYPERIDLSAAALYHSGNLLHNGGQNTKAQALWLELRQKYPQSVWAHQAGSIMKVEN